MPKQTTDIDSISQRFNAGALRYDTYAQIQHQVVDDFSLFLGSSLKQARQIIDLGCGTGGLLSKCCELADAASLIGVDISSSMLDELVARAVLAEPVLASMENTGLTSGVFDWVLSTSALQWADVEQAIAEMSRLCSSDGVIAISWFSETTLGAWRQLWGGEFFELPSKPKVIKELCRHGFQIRKSQSKLYLDQKTSFDHAVRSVNGIGAGKSSSQRRRISRSQYDSAKNGFELKVNQSGYFSMEYPTEFLLASRS